jgi:hypothetical protein
MKNCCNYKFLIFSILLFFLFFIPQAKAQFQYDSALAKKDTPYVINYNNPYTFPAFTFNLVPIYGEYQRMNRVFGGGAQLDYMQKGASASISFFMAYPGYDNVKGRFKPTYALNEPKLYKLFESWVAYHLSDRNIGSIMSYQPGGYDMRENLKEVYVPYNYRRIYAVRGGYQSMISGVEASNANAFVSDAGTYTDGHFTSMTTSTIFAGIFTTRIDKIGLTDVTGRKRRRKAKQWFADVMLAPFITLDDLKFSDSQFVNISKTPLNRFGWRVGYQIMNNQLTLTRIEIGQRPGLQGFNYYGSLTVGLTLFSVGKKDIGEKADRHRANIHRDTKTVSP